MKKPSHSRSKEEYFAEYSEKALQKGGGTLEGAISWLYRQRPPNRASAERVNGWLNAIKAFEQQRQALELDEEGGQDSDEAGESYLAQEEGHPMSVDDLGLLIGRKHAQLSKGARSLARWSAGAFVATWIFRDIPISHGGPGLFASLNTDARAGLACLAQVPLVFPLFLFVFALYLTHGSLYTSLRETLVGTENPFRISFERGMRVNSLMRSLPGPWRRWHVFGWWLVAGLAGMVTIAVTGALLSTSWNAWLVWAMVAVAVWCVVKFEDGLTARPYRQVTPQRPADRQAALRRAREWQELHPDDTSAVPLIYEHSGLSTAEIREEFSQLGTSGPVGFTSNLLRLVMVVLLYSLLPAPDVDRFQSEGVTGCFFTIVHGFASVAEENLMPSIIAAAVLLFLMPISVLVAYLRFMIRYRFPPAAMTQVLVRETPFALRMPIYLIVMAPVVTLIIALLMWASAVVAVRWNSPVAGTVVLVLPAAIFVWAIRRIKVRGPLPQ
jgi:hypothetical protein